MSTLVTSSGFSATAETEEAVREAVALALHGLGENKPALCLLAATVDHDAQKVQTAVQKLLPSVPVHGATTSLGVLTPQGVVMGPGGGVGVMLYSGSDELAFAAGASDFAKGAHAAGAHAAKELLSHGPSGKKPVMVFIAATPGQEEQVLAGIHEVLPGVPVFGGSAADHAILGEWSIFTSDGIKKEGVSLAGFWGDMPIGASIEGPYEATDKHAVVTGAKGRSVTTMDGKRATDVLQSWVGDAIADQVREGGNLLVQTALSPVGIARGKEGEKPFYLLLHPAQAHTEGNIDLFAEAPEGTTLCLMSGSGDTLVGIVDRLVDNCLADANLKPEDVKNAFLIYCAGCAGAIGGRIEEVLSRLNTRLPSVPLLGFCTFGEQGFVPNVGNVHTNLSVALVVQG